MTTRSLADVLHSAPNWHEDARCRDETSFLFFVGAGRGNGYEAKRVCARCPVIHHCLEFAIETRQQFGVWGGMNAKERDAEVRRRRKAQQNTR